MDTARRIERLGDDIVTITGLFSTEECDAMVAYAEGLGFGDAPITTGFGFQMRPEIRNNTRAIVDDVPRANALWERIAPLTRERPGLRAVGLNERFRFYRYAPGQFFRWHHDGAFSRGNGERSHVTMMLYLNEGFLGGSTDFDVGAERLRVTPKMGDVLLFTHALRHQGAPVLEGRKYVLRSDVMFVRS